MISIDKKNVFNEFDFEVSKIESFHFFLTNICKFWAARRINFCYRDDPFCF